MKTTRIVFTPPRGQEDLVQDLDEQSRSLFDDLADSNDEELQEAWVQHGTHAESWVWERIRTDSSAPAWGWIPFTDIQDIHDVKREIAEVENTPATQMISRELVEYNLECLKTGLKAFEAGEQVWINWDDDGTHLAVGGEME